MKSEDDLVAKIYDGALVPATWRDSLVRIAQVAEAKGAALLYVTGGETRSVSSPGIEGAINGFIRDGGVTASVRLASIDAKSAEEASWVTLALRNQPLVSEDPFDTYMLDGGGKHLAAILKASLPPGEVIFLVVWPDERDGQSDMPPLLERLRPHLLRAAWFSAALRREFARGSLAAVEQIGLGGAALARTGSIVESNSYFAATERLWMDRGDRKGAKDPLYDAALPQTAGRNGKVPLASRRLPVRNEQGRLEGLLHIHELESVPSDIFVQAPVLAVLTPIDTPSAPDPTILEAVFQLTPSEAKVAAALAAGRTIGEIAGTTNKSINTVRNQVKSLLAKTGCRRQVDLVQMAARLQIGGV